MRLELSVLLGLAAATASASKWTVQAFKDTNCAGESATWSNDVASSINTGDWYSSIAAQYESDWVFTAWTGAGETGQSYKTATNTCQDVASDAAILSFTLASS
ncbi:uncharacterized protein N7459_002897 [Penicillium hispanicum]|uniref:uncharacterized protein n=1 Tax=Penicillium hispanicum TaxID=1080232 RepID=UPI002540D717|nr:uncharacterized protein N7459_002897 [Penicillium hispanicum]KAJ5587132.1 hypothetical protein N7459_002897 [Penicillium hispanicum]